MRCARVAAAVLALGMLACLAAPTAQTQISEWTIVPDEEGNLRADCNCSSAGFVSLPQLRVVGAGNSGASSLPPPHLDIRYDDAASEFLLEPSEGVRLRVDDVDVAELDERINTLSAENAALRDTQARIQCALTAAGTPDIGEAISVATVGAVDWEHFEISGEHFLAVASWRNGHVWALESAIYTWRDGALETNQTIPTLGAFDIAHFVIGTTHFLAVANSFDGATYNQSSLVLRWNGASFVAHQNISTMGAADWEAFSINDEHFLAVANNRLQTQRSLESVVYRYNGEMFVFNQSIPTIGALDLEHFEIGPEHFLAVASHFNDEDNRYDLHSNVYKFSNGVFAVNQSIPTFGAFDFEHFVMGSEHFLAVANFFADGSYRQESVVYKWVSGAFVANQSFEVIGARDWEHFEAASQHYLFLVSSYNTTSFVQESTLFRWSGEASKFVAVQSVSTTGAAKCRHFVVGTDHHLAVANSVNSSATGNPADTTHVLDSSIYLWNSHCLV